MPIDYLPEPLYTPAERLRSFLLTDASVLVIVGVAMLARGIGLLPPPGQDIHPWEGSIPLSAWIVVWVGLGVTSIIAAPWHKTKVAAYILATDVMLITLWGATFVFVDADELFSRGAIYLGWSLTILWAVWRGRRGEILAH